MENIFKKRLSTVWNDTSRADPVEVGIKGPAGALSSASWVPALDCLGGGDGIGRNGLNTLKSTVKILNPPCLDAGLVWRLQTVVASAFTSECHLAPSVMLLGKPGGSS